MYHVNHKKILIKFVYLPILSVLILLLFSCNGRKERVADIVEYWQGREVKLPPVMTDVISGDTIDINDADFTIVTYVDSVRCTGCKMKLPLWKEFLSSIDSVCDSNVQFLMVVYPSDIKDLHYVIKSTDFNYPIFIDEGDKVSKANSFPEETMLQTFLLDRNRKVTAVGNPVYSSEIARLYKEIILGQISVSVESSSMVSVINSRVDLGNIHRGEARSRGIVFSNHGNDTVRIRKIISSCDCTELSFPNEYLTPGSDQKAVLKFTGDTVTGDFDRSIHVYYLNFEYPTVITVSGNIIY